MAAACALVLTVPASGVIVARSVCDMREMPKSDSFATMRRRRPPPLAALPLPPLRADAASASALSDQVSSTFAGFCGTGRVGSGQVGSGQVGTG